jgi:hypothetical protein
MGSAADEGGDRTLLQGRGGPLGTALANRRRPGRKDASPSLIPILRSSSDKLPAEKLDPGGEHDQGPGFFPALLLASIISGIIWALGFWAWSAL